MAMASNVGSVLRFLGESELERGHDNSLLLVFGLGRNLWKGARSSGIDSLVGPIIIIIISVGLGSGSKARRRLDAQVANWRSSNWRLFLVFDGLDNAVMVSGGTALCSTVVQWTVVGLIEDIRGLLGWSLLASLARMRCAYMMRVL